VAGTAATFGLNISNGLRMGNGAGVEGVAQCGEVIQEQEQDKQEEDF